MIEKQNHQYKKAKVHRHFTPKYSGGLPNIVPVRRLAGALKVHDWNRNSFLRKLRYNRNQRVSIRSERRETFSELALAMVAYADYNSNHKYLFEVMCSVEKLAELCGQLYRYDSGRKSYDPILHALNDWEKAELIVIDRDFDHESRQHKAMRIWIRPEFFMGLGFSLSEMKEILKRFKRWMEKKGLRKSYDQLYAQHVLRLARSNVASLDNKHSLKKLLQKLKRLVIGNDEELENERQHTIKAAEQRKELIEATEPVPDEKRIYWQKYQNWAQQQPLAQRLSFENNIKSKYPELSNDELYQVYVEHLPDR
ncbi:RepA family replication protein [Xenorhabdus sp. SGI246]|uniref:RepA family replication protein n=1 Tax=Xenorhabdus sp. SGI246 TaxID=3158263 RepID=UPI00349F5F60